MKKVGLSHCNKKSAFKHTMAASSEKNSGIHQAAKDLYVCSGNGKGI
jgi:hypothetical protein